jgi:hypothetical protein
VGFETEGLDADLHLLVVEVWVLIQKSSSSSCFIFF